MGSLIVNSLWLIEVDPHRGRVHFITTETPDLRLCAPVLYSTRKGHMGGRESSAMWLQRMSKWS